MWSALFNLVMLRRYRHNPTIVSLKRDTILQLSISIETISIVLSGTPPATPAEHSKPLVYLIDQSLSNIRRLSWTSLKVGEGVQFVRSAFYSDFPYLACFVLLYLFIFRQADPNL